MLEKGSSKSSAAPMKIMKLSKMAENRPRGLNQKFQFEKSTVA
jgi:hypothetical protein